MSFAAIDKVTVSDIQALYDRLNVQRKRLISSTAADVNPAIVQTDKITPSELVRIKDYVEGLSVNQYIGSRASTGLTTDQLNALQSYIIKPEQINRISTTLTTVENTCIHDSANFGANFGFGFGAFGTNFGFGFGAFGTNFNFSFDQTNFGFTSDYGTNFNFSFDQTNFGFSNDGTNFRFNFGTSSSNFGFEAGNGSQACWCRASGVFFGNTSR